jgi:hypothetical protein
MTASAACSLAWEPGFFEGTVLPKKYKIITRAAPVPIVIHCDFFTIQKFRCEGILTILNDKIIKAKT